MRIKNMVFPYNKKTQNIILKTLEQYWLLNSMYESIDAIYSPVFLNCEMLGNQGLKNSLARRPGLVISTFGLAEIICCMPDGLVKKYIGYWQTCQYSRIYLYSYMLYVVCCLISSNVLFIQPLAFCRNWEQRRQKNCVTRHKTASTNDGLPEISKMKYRNRIPERLFPVLPIVKKKKILMQTDPRFFLNVTVNTHIFFLALQWPELWKVSENKTQYQIWKER
jgi:hypothetical protein